MAHRPSLLVDILTRHPSAHPCNMKEFKVFVGLSEDTMTEVLHSSLKNDTVPETFALKHVNGAGIIFPTRFIKIAPISAHGQSFHTSIWYVSLSGIADEAFVERIRSNYGKSREDAVLRHILKHLRQRRLLTPFSSILSRTSLRLEHPLVTALHQKLVLEGSWPETESLIHRISDAGLFDAYRRGACQPHALWTRLRGTDADGDMPSPRGGHAMCMDTERGEIYILGGWDGKKSLDDFWVYEVANDKWRLLSPGTGAEKNGPGARSCHKMAFDSKSGCIYVLGRLSDTDALRGEQGADGATSSEGAAGGSRSRAQQGEAGAESSTEGNGRTTAFCSEFYRYHTRGLASGSWDLLSFDTASSGGPPLIFDHQLVMDSDTQMIYVFGGRIVDGDWSSHKYSGLYSYNIRTSKWKLLQTPDPSTSTPQNFIPPRFGHSMILCTRAQTLLIFAGQRDANYLSDMHAFDLRTNTAREVCANFSTPSVGGPDACFTQRAVVDQELGEIYVFCGLTRSPQQGSATLLHTDSPSWVYRYDPIRPDRPGKWTRILPVPLSERDEIKGAEKRAEPQPRYAHQVAYDPRTKTVYLHGGNTGLRKRAGRSGNAERSYEEMRWDDNEEDGGPEAGGGEEKENDKDAAQEIAMRLDDFWSMNLERPAPEEIIRRAIYHVRQQQFREMCEELPPVKALNFLQTEVSAAVDHNNADETRTFRSLLSHLLAPPARPIQSGGSRSDTPESSWTNKLGDDNENMDDGTTDSDFLMSQEDPEERNLRGEGAVPLNVDRFQQRTEVFETLLRFVDESAKEPSGSLLDLVERNGEEW
ncbi:hypothetical protein PLICRDRAFT_480070 [Plicaturopsis crispa FD-325 SS-3]|nr:hypothetical protein PLICRDRAFT_480070 [Plicaturopsis crispa FD-325 SS-3]